MLCTLVISTMQSITRVHLCTDPSIIYRLKYVIALREALELCTDKVCDCQNVYLCLLLELEKLAIMIEVEQNEGTVSSKKLPEPGKQRCLLKKN